MILFRRVLLKSTQFNYVTINKYWSNVSLVIYIIANFSVSLQLSERYYIILSLTSNFIIISGMVCQLLGAYHGIPLKNVTYKNNNISFANNVNAYEFILN